MKNGIEIRWHGRGGQGAKTAALLLADVAFKTGKHVQGFPEYGPERMGAPITAYNRISSDVIRVHSNIYDPDFVAVVDETLLHTVDVTAGLKKEGAIIVNTAKSKEEIMPQLNGYEGRVVTIDARTISEEENISRTPRCWQQLLQPQVLCRKRHFYMRCVLLTNINLQRNRKLSMEI